MSETFSYLFTLLFRYLFSLTAKWFSFSPDSPTRTDFRGGRYGAVVNCSPLSIVLSFCIDFLINRIQLGVSLLIRSLAYHLYFLSTPFFLLPQYSSQTSVWCVGGLERERRWAHFLFGELSFSEERRIASFGFLLLPTHLSTIYEFLLTVCPNGQRFRSYSACSVCVFSTSWSLADSLSWKALCACQDIPKYGLEYYVQLAGEMFLTFFEADSDDGTVTFGKAVVNERGA